MSHDKILPWPAISREELGNHKIFSLSRTVRRSPKGDREHAFFGLEAPDWVNVLAVTEEKQLILIEQYRHGTDCVTLEIPGGAVDRDEDPAEAGGRELEEETGYRPRQLELLGWVETNPAFLNNRCWTYLATGCSPDGKINFDPSEEIEVQLVDLSRFTELIQEGKIRHSLVVAAHDHLQRGISRGAPWVAEIFGRE